MATLTKQKIVITGLEATYAAASGGGDVAPNDGNQFLHVINGSGADVEVTIAVQNASPRSPSLGQLSLTNRVVDVTAGEERLIGPFAPGLFNNSSGQIAISYEATTSVTVAWLEFNPQIS